MLQLKHIIFHIIFPYFQPYDHILSNCYIHKYKTSHIFFPAIASIYR